jgi:hypothetical protein
LLHAFVKNYTVYNGLLPSLDYGSKPTSNLARIHFTPGLVRRSIKKLLHKTKGGPDGIPILFYLNSCEELCYLLALLFELCFEHSILPSVWLSAYITPLFKTGKLAEATNYRSVALTCTMCKQMESIIKIQVVSYPVGKNLISKHQHAFIMHHSTSTNLLQSTQDWLVSLNSHSCTYVVYIDFSKAFDSIVISKMLTKLEYIMASRGCF